MDALLTNTQTVQGTYPYWDFQVAGNIVPILLGQIEQSQQAIVIAYTQKGLIPQMPTVGVNWTGVLAGSENFSSIDVDIVAGLNTAKLPYRPYYSIVGANNNGINVRLIKQ